MSAIEISEVCPEQLNVHWASEGGYQRPLKESRMGENSDLHPFNPKSVGCLAVSQRADGTLWLMDGQHRMEKARRSGHGRTKFLAQVHTGLTFAEEAQMFLDLNKYQKVQLIDEFFARVAAGEDAALKIQSVITRYGWVLRGGASTGSFAAIAALESIYDGANIRKEGQQLEACDRVFEILTAAFGHSSHAVNQNLVKGLGLVILRHGAAVDTDKLVNELGKTEGGPNVILGKAQALKSIRGGSMANAVAEIVVEMHNKGRRIHHIPQWTRA